MADPQFVHTEAYARKASGKKANVDDIVAEAVREPSHVPHVDKPRAPAIIFGCDPRMIPTIISERTAGAKGVTGAPITVRALVLLTVVASWPIPRSQVGRDKKRAEDYIRWRALTLKFLSLQFAGALVSVVEHRDETYLHLHGYAVPEQIDGTFGIETISPPHHAQITAQRAGKSFKDQQFAFKAAARKFQNQFYLEVGQFAGLERYGPRRLRVTRAEIMARKNAATLAQQADKQRIANEVAEACRGRDAEILKRKAQLDDYFQITKGLVKMLKSLGLEDEVRQILEDAKRPAENEALPRSPGFG